jgi:hypothetical protein
VAQPYELAKRVRRSLSEAKAKTDGDRSYVVRLHS